MIRKLFFGFVIVTAFIVAACGRQVTPNPPDFGAGGAPPGYMSVKFDVSGQFNFSNYQYWVVFDTSGNGLTPDTHPFQSNWAGYSSALEIAGAGGATFARAIQFVKNSNPGIPPAFVPLITTPQQLQYTANSNGTGTEFTVLFQRTIFNSIIQSPGPSPTPFAPTWRFNAFTTQATGQNQLVYVDSMGAGGPVDPQWNSPALVVAAPTPPPPAPSPPPPFDTVFYALSSGLQIDPSAQIVSIEIANNP